MDTAKAVHPILLVDDHDDTRILFKEILELYGFQVVTVADGSKALAALATIDPCVILLDLGLPDVLGIDLIAALRAAAPHAPIYALSGSDHLRRRALAAGCDGFLLKPVPVAALRGVVSQTCSTPAA